VRSDSVDSNYHLTELIDTPGECDPIIASNVLEKSIAYVFVLPYGHLGDSSDIAILRKILTTDPGEFI